MSLLLLSCVAYSETTIDTVNEDFHKVKRDVFGKKETVSRQAKASPDANR
jgi:hypothetical protein